jgi:hypothetical protein
MTNRFPFLVAAAALLSLSLAAQAADAPKSAASPEDLCDGQVQTIRISKIKSNGSLAGFMEAVADNNAWYKSHNVEGGIQIGARVITRDPESKAFRLAEDEVVTIHTYPAKFQPPGHDDAWKAFVKKYQENSTVETQKMICVPKSAQ